MQTLNAELLNHYNATLTLERWCGVHRLASPAHIVAERIPGVDKPSTQQQRAQLGVTASDPVRYRRVKLRCGALVLSEADNWYVPARLTPEMNRTLESTDTPFGKVVQALHFHRHTAASALLWHLLPEGWEMEASTASEGTAAHAAGATLGSPPPCWSIEPCSPCRTALLSAKSWRRTWTAC